MNGKPDSAIKTIVLVHGGFVDGSGWEEVYKILKKDGYTVSVVQNRVGLVAHQGSPARRSRTADTVTTRRLPISRQGEVSRLLRGQRGSGKGRLHG